MSKFVLVSVPNLVVDASAKNLFWVICFSNPFIQFCSYFPSFARFSYRFFWFWFWLSSPSSSPSKSFDPKLNIDSPPVHDAAIGCQPPKNHRRRRPKRAVVSARWWGESLCPCRAISGAEIWETHSGLDQIRELNRHPVFLLFPFPWPRKRSIHLVRALTSALASSNWNVKIQVWERKQDQCIARV